MLQVLWAILLTVVPNLIIGGVAIREIARRAPAKSDNRPPVRNVVRSRVMARAPLLTGATIGVLNMAAWLTWTVSKDGQIRSPRIIGYGEYPEWQIGLLVISLLICLTKTQEPMSTFYDELRVGLGIATGVGISACAGTADDPTGLSLIGVVLTQIGATTVAILFTLGRHRYRTTGKV